MSPHSETSSCKTKFLRCNLSHAENTETWATKYNEMIYIKERISHGSGNVSQEQ